MSARKPFTKRERHRATQNGLGHRPVNNWGDGDLPAPWAQGDVVYLASPVNEEQRKRLNGQTCGYFVITYATSIDEGDAWYFRVWDGKSGRGSDRMHVAFTERCAWDTPVDFMHGFQLVETADPEGLALRERMIADGWQFSDRWDVCPTCGHITPKVLSSHGESR